MKKSKRGPRVKTQLRKEELKSRIIKHLGYDRRGTFASDLDYVLSKLSEADLYVLMIAQHGKKPYDA